MSDINTVRVTEQAKDQLIRLKRVTGIKNWNILCRWALCTSLSDPTPPLVRNVVPDSNVEMTWRTFGGEWSHVYAALIKQRIIADESEVTPEMVTQTFLAHLHRGIGALSREPHRPTIGELVERACDI